MPGPDPAPQEKKDLEEQSVHVGNTTTTTQQSPPTDLERLKTILAELDVPEEEVLQILARLNNADRQTVIKDHKAALVACLNLDEMKQAWQSPLDWE